MYRLLIEWSLIGIILVSSLPKAAMAQDKPEWTDPIHKCWSNGEIQLSSRKNASDNDKTIISHLINERIQALDSETGKSLWTRELTGQLASEIFVKGKSLYFSVVQTDAAPAVSTIATKFGTTDHNLKVNAVDIDSGLNNGRFDVLENSELKGNSEFTILINDQILYLVSKSGNITAILEADNSILWTKNLNTSLSAFPFIRENNMYVGTKNKTVIEVSLRTGQIENQIPLGFEPTSIAANKTILFAGDKEGNISAIDLSNITQYWRSLTGGEIVEIDILGDDILVSSNDNFVYRFSGSKGTKLWKRKLSGRILGNVILENEIGAFLSVGSNEVLLVDLENGKIVNRISIGSSDYFVSAPISIDGKIILSTNQGLEAYSPLCIPEPTSGVLK